jgi:hypothetical protein
MSLLVSAGLASERGVCGVWTLLSLLNRVSGPPSLHWHLQCDNGPSVIEVFEENSLLPYQAYKNCLGTV